MTLTANILSNESEFSSYCGFSPWTSTSRRGRLMPALLTSASIRPYLATTASAIACTLALSVTLHCTQYAPSSSAPVSTFISTMTTDAPTFRSVSATCLPMPDAPPVTMTTLSSSSSQFSFITVSSYRSFLISRLSASDLLLSPFYGGNCRFLMPPFAGLRKCICSPVFHFPEFFPFNCPICEKLFRLFCALRFNNSFFNKIFNKSLYLLYCIQPVCQCNIVYKK